MFTRCQRDGRQAARYSAGSKSEVREKESGWLTRVELNKFTEMTLIIVTAVNVWYLSPVCRFVVRENSTNLGFWYKESQCLTIYEDHFCSKCILRCRGYLISRIP